MSLDLLPAPEYSAIPLQTAGILLAVALASRLLFEEGPRARALRATAVGTAFAIACLTMLPALESRVRRLNDVRNATAEVTEAQARTRCVADGGHAQLVSFFAWAQHRMGRGDRWWDASQTPITAPCKIYAFLPALPAADPADADWTVYVGGVPPDLADVVEAGGPAVLRFGPEAGMVRRAP